MLNPNKIFLHYITETTSNKCYFVNNVGNVDLSNDLQYFLDQEPQGWFDTEISFGRSTKYYGLNRTFTIPLKFVGDGAKIIRYHLYKGKGIEAPLTLIILKWNPDNDTYELYYKGELDLTKTTDTADGITVNVMEGGIVKLLKTYESTVFEFPVDGSIPENILVNIDGLKLTDTFFYQINDYSDVHKLSALSASFINNVGDNIGIEKGSQNYEEFTDGAAYLASSSNYLFSSTFPISITISGTFIIRTTSFTSTATVPKIFFNTSNGQIINVNTAFVAPGMTRTITMPPTVVNMAANEKLFLFINPYPSGYKYEMLQSSFQIDFTSRMPATKCWGIVAKDLFKLLVQKIGNGQYQVQSSLLDQRKNFVLTSGFAIRGDEKAVLKISLADFFQTFNAILNASMSNLPSDSGNDLIFLESKEFVFDSSSTNISLGEVSNFKISIANDYFYSTVKIGYPPQQYDEKTGQNEWNTTFQWQSPITREQKELSLVTKARGDSYGVEFVRFLYGGKSTTNNSADSDVFILNVDAASAGAKVFVASSTQTKTYTSFPFNLVYDTLNGVDFTTSDNAQFTYTGIAAAATIAVAAQLKKSDNSNAIFKVLRNTEVLYAVTQAADGSTVNANIPVVLNPNDVIKVVVDYVSGVSSVNVSFPTLNISFGSTTVYNLKRKVYAATNGIPNPDAAYNVEDMTPKRMLLRHGNYLKSTTFNLPVTYLKFLTCDKNPNLSTTDGITTITENADVPISSLDDPLFYPFVFEFDTTVPLNFITIYNAAANGHISFQYNGKTYYGFPLEVKAKPALNESQTWKLLCSPKTSMDDLLSLDIDGLNFLDMADLSATISGLCPVKFVPLGVDFPAQYHFRHMDSDWFTEQIKFWANQKGYAQKFQQNDTIALQVITNGLSPVEAQIIDDKGNNVGAPVALNQITTGAIVSPKQLWQGNINISSLSGVYYLVLTAGAGTTVQYISEPIEVKADHPMTLLFEYSHRTNKQATVFHPSADGSQDYTPSLRVEGWLSDFSPESKFVTYEDEPADLEMENGFAYRKYKLNIGINDGVPDWVIDKINRILLLSSVKIDGVSYTRDADSKFEVTTANGNLKKWWTIDIREARNRDSVSVNTTGEIDKNITIVYNINTKAFGLGDGTVEVTKVD